jgi:catechol 2,3-dioxygenase-like lactoylglutathione lyase family enzyme
VNLRHIALACASEENADRLFVELLGLRKSDPKRLAPALAGAIFGIASEMTVINYRGDDLHFEVFVGRRPPDAAGRLDHVCLEVEDLAEFLDRGRRLGMEVVRVPRGDSTLTFVRGPEGHLFEIKEK